jgi:hypothetical protein
MKNFRKNEQNEFICEECEKICKDKTVLSIHNIKMHNLNPKEYFDKWIKETGEGFCKICGKETNLIRSDWGYKNTCSKKCANIYSGIRTKEEILKKYGVKNVYQVKEIKEKCKQIKKEKYGDEKYQNREQIEKTNLEKYGTKYPLQSKEIQEKIKQNNLKNYGVKYNWQREDIKENSKNTCFEKYGDKYYRNPEKSKQTCLNNFGVENPFQSEEIKEKSKQTKLKRYGDENYNNPEKNKETCLKKYGVENPSQNREISDKAFKTRISLKRYRDTDLWYQGSYEYDFIDKYLPLFPDLQRGPSIKYIFNGKNKIYHPDFYIPSLNLIIEIKNSYLAKKNKDEIEAKQKATISNGFKYLLILDKQYDYLNNIVL